MAVSLRAKYDADANKLRDSTLTTISPRFKKNAFVGRFGLTKAMLTSQRTPMMHPHPTSATSRSLEIFHYISPVVIAVYYISASLITACTLQKTVDDSTNRKRRAVAIWLLPLVPLSFVSLLSAIISMKALTDHLAGTSHLLLRQGS